MIQYSSILDSCYVRTCSRRKGYSLIHFSGARYLLKVNKIQM
jgi:hypothetical protein